MTRYVGSYDGLKDAWDALMAETGRRNLSYRWPGWEEYLLGPDAESDPAKYETLLVCGVE